MKSKIIAFFISLVVTVVSFLLILFIENKIYNPEGTTSVYVVKEEKIEKGCIIDEKNFDELFDVQKRRSDQIPKVYLENKEDIYNHRLNQDIYENQVVTCDKFDDLDDELSEISEKRLTTFKAGNISNVVGGMLRAGDKVDIILTSKNQSITILEDAFISEVRTSDGVKIDKLDKTKSAQIITFTMDISDVEKLEAAEAQGTINLAKVED
ncbi:MAG: hypothetical protein E7213_01875 [Clostridium sp.]|nr:hypothetical protein [Clostridium sp.]